MLFAIKRKDPVAPYLGKLTQNPTTGDWSAQWTNELNSLSVYTGEEVAGRLIGVGENLAKGMSAESIYQVIPVAEQEVGQCKYVLDGVRCRYSDGHPQEHLAMEEEEHDFSNDPDTNQTTATKPNRYASGPCPKCPCPKCNGKMVERVNRKTQSKFYGCVDWPNCTGTRRA